LSYATFTPRESASRDVLSARGVLPLRGPWAWEIEIDATAAETPAKGAPATLAIGGRSFVGYVRDVAPWHGRERLILEAGVAGMRTTIEAQGFESALLSELVSRAVSDAGETLAAEVGSDVVIELSERARGPAGVVLSVLCEAHGLGWRFTDAGSVLVAPERWIEAPDVSALELDPDGADGSTEIAPLVPSLDPGMTWRERRIERVVYLLPEGQSLTARLVFERSEAPGDMRGLFERAVRAALRELAFTKRWPSRVESQRDDGRLQLVPDDTTHAGTPPVPALYGLPGARAVVPEGSRVGLVFDGADPSRPRAAGWEEATPARELHLDASELVALAGGALGVVRVSDTGDAGRLTAVGAALGYTGGDGLVQWVLTGTAGATPVTWVMTPVSNPADVGRITTLATKGSSIVKAGG